MERPPSRHLSAVGCKQLLCDDKPERDAGWRMRGEVFSDLVVIGRDHQGHVGNTGVGQRAEDVIEKGPAVDRNHRLASRVGGAPLLVAETRVGIRRAHSRTQTAREYDGARGHM